MSHVRYLSVTKSRVKHLLVRMSRVRLLCQNVSVIYQPESQVLGLYLSKFHVLGTYQSAHVFALSVIIPFGPPECQIFGVYQPECHVLRIYQSERRVLGLYGNTRTDQKVPRLILLLGYGYTSGDPCLQGGVLELPLSLGQWLVPARLSVLCHLRSKRVVYLRLVIVRAVRDVGRASAARVHQVLCKTGKKWCGGI